jgi:hypothetical protein
MFGSLGTAIFLIKNSPLVQIVVCGISHEMLCFVLWIKFFKYRCCELAMGVQKKSRFPPMYLTVNI